jgi:WD40 repeat protein
MVTDTGQSVLRYAGHSKAVLSISYLADDTWLISAGADHTLQLWAAATGNLVRTLDNHVGTVNQLATRPRAGDGPAIVASASEDRTVRLWQPGIGRLVRFARLPSPARVLAWSADGKQLLVGCNDGHLRALDPATATVSSDQSALAGRIHVIAISPANDGILLAGESAPIRVR